MRVRLILRWWGFWLSDKAQRAAASSSALMRSASSSVISSAPDSTVPVIRARASSDIGSEAPATLRKPAR